MSPEPTSTASDADAPTLDASDLDQYMGVPMEPGELKEPVALNDIRRGQHLLPQRTADRQVPGAAVLPREADADQRLRQRAQSIRFSIEGE